MKKYALLILPLLFNILFVHAQKKEQYIVFSVTGSVTKGNVIIQPKQLLNSTDKITIPEYAQISLFDEEGKRLYAIGESGTHQVQTIVTKMQPSVKQLTSNYVKYLKDQLFGNSKKYSEKTYIKTVSTTGFRGEEEDILFAKSILNKLDFRNSTTLSNLFKADIHVESDYNIMFELLSYRDKSVLKDNTIIKNPYHLQVTNGDNVPLFVNVLAITEDDSPQLILKPSEKYGFCNYLVPPNSIISFMDQPYRSIDDKKVCFILVASEIPIDFRILKSYKELNVTPSHDMKTGVKVELR